MRVRTVIAAATAAVTAALMTGCAGQPGAAAIVDGEVISQSDVATAQAEITEHIDQVSAGVVVHFLVIGPFLNALAADRGLVISQDEIYDLVAGAEGEAAADALGEASYDVLRSNVLAQELLGGQDEEANFAELQVRLMAADVEVNPRYGQFNPERGVVEAVPLDWIRYVQ